MEEMNALAFLNYWSITIDYNKREAEQIKAMNK